MKKICFLVGYYPIYKGGAEYQSLLIAHQLRKDYQIFFISCDHNENEKKEFGEDIVYKLRTPEFNTFGKLFFLQKKKLFKILVDEKPDIIYQRVLSSITGLAAQYCCEHKCTMIWHVAHKNDVIRGEFKLGKRLLFDIVENRLANFGIKNAGKIICQTEYQKDLLLKNFNRHADMVIRNFHPTVIGEMKKSIPIKVVWIANYKEFKRIELFIELVKRLNSLKDVNFIMAGRLPTNTLLHEIKSAAVRIQNLEILGEITNEQVNSLLSESHLLVNTSTSEGFPNTFIQAWLREVPVVSLSVDPDDLIKREGIGFHSGKFEKLVSDVSELIENNNLRINMGKKARLFAEKEFDILTNVEKIKSLLN